MLKATIKLLFVLIIVFLIYNTFFFASDYDKLSDLDKRMLDRIDLGFDTFIENKESIWSDFDIDERPFILVKQRKSNGLLNTHGYVFNFDEDKLPIFAKKINLKDDFFTDNVYRIPMVSLWISKVPPVLNFHDYGDYFYFKYNKTYLDDDDLAFELVTFVFHEAFHFYIQKDWPILFPNESIVHNDEYYDSLYKQLYSIEEAYNAVSRAEKIKHLRDLVVEREKLLKTQPVFKYKLILENEEGTARYIEHRLTKLDKMLGDHRLYEWLTKQEKLELFSIHIEIAKKEREEFGESGTVKNSIWYNTGSFLGLILDELDKSWKAKVGPTEDGEGQITIYDAIKDVVGV